MFKTATLPLHDEGTAEEKLWRAVIARTLEEWVCGPLAFSRKAEKFLFEDTSDFKAVCSSAGMDPDRLRNRLRSIRARGLENFSTPFRMRTQRKFSPHLHGNWSPKAYGV